MHLDEAWSLTFSTLFLCVHVYRSNNLSLYLHDSLHIFLLISIFLSHPVCPSVYTAVQQHACMFTTSRGIMEVKERRPYCSLSKSRKDKEGPYTGETAQSVYSFICSLVNFLFHPFVESVSQSVSHPVCRRRSIAGLKG